VGLGLRNGRDRREGVLSVHVVYSVVWYRFTEPQGKCMYVRVT
jgi:hypothetical protein